jgi:glycosyltransferase involved in cell wall biosynthesis
MNALRIQKSFRDLRQLVEREEINLIHTDSPRWTFYLGSIGKSLKIPVVYHARVSTPEPALYERRIYYLSTKVIAVSEFAKKRFDRFPKADQKVDVIYNAVDTQRFNLQCDGSRLRSELGIGQEIVIGMAGRITPSKGQKEFLEAAAKVIPDLPNAKFVIIGEENADGYRSELEEMVRQLSLKGFVHLCPFRQDMPATMAALDILVNASHSEGFSRVIIEGMASGRPVIATETGGNSEAVLNDVTGLLVPPKDPDRLAQAILTLGTDEQLRQRMRIAARERAEKLFSVDAQIDKIETLYGRLLG